MTALLDVLPCAHPTCDSTSEEQEPLLKHEPLAEDAESESDSGVESLVDLEITTNSVPEPPSIPPCVPFHPPLHRWVSRETPDPVPPSIPPALHRDQTEQVFPIDVVCRGITPPMVTPVIQPADTSATCEICYKLTTVELPCCSAHICYLCIALFEGYCPNCSYSATQEDTWAQTAATPSFPCEICNELTNVHLPCCSAYICSACTIDFQGLCPWCSGTMDFQATITTEPASPCEVCYEMTSVKRPCCSINVCNDCLHQIVVVNVNDGVTSISCPNPECDQLLLRDEILTVLNTKQDLGTKDKYERFRLAKCTSDKEKVCPNCSWLTAIKTDKKVRKWKKSDIHITCEKCDLEWCFKCHAPWHKNITCKEFKRGNKEFRKWITGKDMKGNANGRHCPSCKIPIQRSDGCPHMTCSDCHCEFCYQCGCRFMNLPGILGNHNSSLGFAGCKYNYEPDNSVKRVSVRGSYLFAKMVTVMGNPGLMVAGAGVLIVAGVIVIPVYGGYKLYQHYSAKRAIRQEREMTRQAALRRRYT